VRTLRVYLETTLFNFYFDENRDVLMLNSKAQKPPDQNAYKQPGKMPG
jgi:hypothetical protein